jgi:hypothetical protein
MSPPIEVGPDAINARANHQIPTTTTKSEYKQDTRFDDLAARGRRRGHALRSAPISPCGCIRDPDVDVHRCSNNDVITDVQAAAAIAAAQLLRSLGVPGLFDTATCRAMWPHDRQLATECFRFSHGEAA